MSDKRAKFEEIAESLREQISRGKLGESLPSERILAKTHGTTPMTVRRALEELEADGLILRRPRRATQILRRATPIRIYCGRCEAVRQVFMSFLPRRFPGESFDFLEVEATEAVIGSCDIVMAPTTVLHDYETFFEPLPDELVERLRGNPGIGVAVLDLHRNAGRHFGIPVLESAGGMQVNLSLLRELGIDSLPAVDLPRMMELAQLLARRGDGIALMDSAFYNALIMHLVLMSSRADEPWPEAGEQALELALHRYQDLMAGGTGDFAAGRALFRIVCRQSILEYATREQLAFPVEVIPLPGGSPWSGIPFSESLMVSRDHPMPGRLFEICESLLEPAAQDAIARTRHGFPVLASARYLSLQLPVEGDGVFAFGLERCCYRQPPLLRQLWPVVWSALLDVLDGASTMEEARSAILATWRGLVFRQRANRRFVNQFGVRGGLANAVA